MWTAFQSAPSTFYALWAWIRKAISTYWVWRQGYRKTPRWFRTCWTTCCGGDWIPRFDGGLLSTGLRRCGPGLMRCLARMLRCSVAASTRYATSWPICPKNSTIKPGRRCGRTLSWTPRPAKSDSNHCPGGWNAKDSRRRRACGKTLGKCSRSTAWACRPHWAAVWARPTCWILPHAGLCEKTGM